MLGAARKPVSLTIRSVAWIVLAIAFLTLDILRIERLHRAGYAAGWAAWVQLLLWSAALVGWSWTAWKQWQQRKVERRVV